jgi:aminoglycoside phosphotransferase (APT) family kinase protein
VSSGPEGGPPVPRASSSTAAATAIAERFAVEGRLRTIAPQAGGHINESWVVTWDRPRGPSCFLLQHVNRFVFRRPGLVMENLARVTRHIASRLEREGTPSRERRVLSLVPTREGASHLVDADGETWRLFPWIEGTRSWEHAETTSQAGAAAFAFGRFLRQLADLPEPPLHETIPRFHDTPARLVALERAWGADAAGRASSAGRETAALLDRRRVAGALVDRVERGDLAVRTAHNDAKIANVLFDTSTGEPLCVVDLDTVMPGLALNDFGDLVRSAVSDSAEDERDLSRVSVRMDVFRALARGFVEGAGDLLSPLERSLLATAGKVIVLEQAARFLTDHLEGDPYYGADRPGHNLDRARSQLRLLESLEEHETELERVVEEIGTTGSSPT